MAAFRHEDPAGALVSLLAPAAPLTAGARAAADYDNSPRGFLAGVPKLTVQYASGPPAAGADVAELYLLPGDGAASEAFAAGGDGTLGADAAPQQVFYVGTLVSVQPSLSVPDVLMLPPLPLYPHGNRFVVTNVSGQTWAATWQLALLPYRPEVVEA